MFNWFRKPRNLVWTGDVLIDARTDEVLARVFLDDRPTTQFYRWEGWIGHFALGRGRAFLTKDGAKKFVEEKFR